MDIGTNSVRLAVVEVKTNQTWTTLASQKQVVRLGEGEFDQAPIDSAKGKEDGEGGRHSLTETAIARGALVCARFAEVARGFGAEEIVALATAAVREADNGHEFVKRVRDLADLDVRIISGQEEARLIYLGVISGIDLPPTSRALIMDIGGGSTELIVGDSQNYVFLDSLKMGAIRLTAEGVPDPSKPVTADAWDDLQRRVRSLLVPAARSIARAGFSVMYGSSGTAQNLAEIIANASATPNPTSLRNYELSLADVQATTRRLCALTLEQRRRVPGINPERADIIIGGSAILQTIMETVGATAIRISDRGVREGIILDRLRRDPRAWKTAWETWTAPGAAPFGSSWPRPAWTRRTRPTSSACLCPCLTSGRHWACTTTAPPASFWNMPPCCTTPASSSPTPTISSTRII